MREIHADTLAAISDPAGFFPVVMVHVDWPDAAVRAHSNLGSLSWGGNSWTGVGSFAQVSVPGEETGLASADAMIGLVGVDETLNGHLDDDARGRDATILFGAVTARDGATLIGAPFEAWAGTVDSLTDTIRPARGGLERGVSVSLSDGPSQRSVSATRHSDEDQRARYPGDTAGRLLRGIENEGLSHRWPE